jgi:hypothetical protein
MTIDQMKSNEALPFNKKDLNLILRVLSYYKMERNIIIVIVTKNGAQVFKIPEKLNKKAFNVRLSEYFTFNLYSIYIYK